MDAQLRSELQTFLQDEISDKTLQAVIKIVLPDTLQAKLDFAGNYQAFIVEVIRELDKYGNLSEGQPALAVLLGELQGHVGVDKQAALEHLIERVHEEAKRKRQPTKKEAGVYHNPPVRRALPMSLLLAVMLMVGLGLGVALAYSNVIRDIPLLVASPTNNAPLDTEAESPRTPTTTRTPRSSSSPTPNFTPTPIPASKILLHEDFEDGAAPDLRPRPWTNWEIVEETDGNHAYLGRPSWAVEFGAADWENYGFSVRFKPLVFEDFFAIGFRAQRFMTNREQHYFVSFDPVLNLSLQRADNSNDWPRLVNKRDFELKINDWNTLWVEANGTEIKVRCNDVEFSTFDYQLKNGSLYFVIHGDQNKDNTIILFDDIRVWSLDP